jgi:hypothetical protein
MPLGASAHPPARSKFTGAPCPSNGLLLLKDGEGVDLASFRISARSDDGQRPPVARHDMKTRLDNLPGIRTSEFYNIGIDAGVRG